MKQLVFQKRNNLLFLHSRFLLYKKSSCFLASLWVFVVKKNFPSNNNKFNVYHEGAKCLEVALSVLLIKFFVLLRAPLSISGEKNYLTSNNNKFKVYLEVAKCLEVALSVLLIKFFVLLRAPLSLCGEKKTTNSIK